MFQLFNRIAKVTEAELNALLDKVEDPEKMLDQYLRDMADDLKDAEKSVAEQIAIEKNYARQVKELQELVTKRQTQAEKAVQAGNDDLARRALKDKSEQEKELNEVVAVHKTALENAEKLRRQLVEMKDEFESMQRRKEMLVARAKSAKAQKQINQAMSSFGTNNAKAGFDKMAEKVNKLEAEAQTAEELRHSSKSLDDEFDALETNDSAVDDELAALKARLGK